jgi:hypothetical protein
MASGVLVPRDPVVLQRTIVSSLVPNVLASLPIGYWQRRVGARAFALQMVPAQPRHAQTVTVTRLPGGPPITVLRTSVMTWGWVPWIWDGDARLAVSEARSAMRRVLAASTTAYASVVFIVHARWPAAQVLPRLRLTPATTDSTAVGLVTIDELADLFEEAALDLDATRGALLAQDAARSLRLVHVRSPATTTRGPDSLIG